MYGGSKLYSIYFPFNIITRIHFNLIKVPFALLDCFINYPELVRVYNLISEGGKVGSLFIVHCWTGGGE